MNRYLQQIILLFMMLISSSCLNMFEVKSKESAPQKTTINPQVYFQAKNYEFTSVAFSHDSRYLVAGTFYGDLLLFDIESKKEINKVKILGNGTRVEKLSFSSNDQAVFAFSGHNLATQSLLEWTIGNSSLTELFNIQRNNVPYPFFSSSGKYVIFRSGWEPQSSTSTYTLYDLKNRQIENKFYSSTGSQLKYLFKFNKNENNVLERKGNKIDSIDIKTKQLREEIKPNVLMANDFALSPNGKILAANTKEEVVVSADESYMIYPVIIYSLSQNKVIHTINNNMKDDSLLAFSSDSQYLATGINGLNSEKNEIKIWNLETGKEVASLLPDSPRSSENRLNDFSFSPDGKYLAAATANKLYIWSLK